MQKARQLYIVFFLASCIACNAASDMTFIRKKTIEANTENFPGCAVGALNKASYAYVTEIDQANKIIELRRNSDANVPGLLGRLAKVDQNHVNIYVSKQLKDNKNEEIDADRFISSLTQMVQSECR